MPFSLDQVSLDLGPRPLLRDLSLHIAPGERVVVNGQLGVTPGGKVRVEEPQSAAPPTAKEAASK